ncbi:polysaccharide biosynthesis protein [Sulfurovum sp. CS9]|uniref:polysaccharide biosynthesis protein n=1 Tax=Sulfurovum sp. CS9 TaxID=3391146 RepID=UPI0039E85AAF
MIILLTFGTFWWTFFIFHHAFDLELVLVVVSVRMLASLILFEDYSLSWSKSSAKTFLLKSVVYILAFMAYMPFYYQVVSFSLMVSELLSYLFILNFLVYFYYFLINRSRVEKTKTVVIYGAGKAGIKLEEEFRDSEYKVKYFVDDDRGMQKRSIDGVRVLSKKKLKRKIDNDRRYDLLVIAMPSAPQKRIKEIYKNLGDHFIEIKILPTLDEILREKDFASQLKNLSVADLMARHPKDLDKEAISAFLKGKVVLITGAGGSIGSEIARQCVQFGVRKLILIDNSEYNLYSIEQELENSDNMELVVVLQSVVNRKNLGKTFDRYQPQIVIHAAAYKHVPMVEANIEEGIINNIIGTKNLIDTAISHGVEKCILISTDKAVRPTNVMGATKRICELYAQNSFSYETDIVAVRFGNVLGSSGSVIPKFRAQIEKGQNITVTHPDITRYFMLIPEACELVLQAGAIGTGGEIFILDMGEPVKIVDLAQKMIDLSGHDDITIEFTGLRPGEKLYEELLIDDTECSTRYESVTVAKRTDYNIDRLDQDIEELIRTEDKLRKLKDIVPEFVHKP